MDWWGSLSGGRGWRSWYILRCTHCENWTNVWEERWYSGAMTVAFKHKAGARMDTAENETLSFWGPWSPSKFQMNSWKIGMTKWEQTNKQTTERKWEAKHNPSRKQLGFGRVGAVSSWKRKPKAYAANVSLITQQDIMEMFSNCFYFAIDPKET